MWYWENLKYKSFVQGGTWHMPQPQASGFAREKWHPLFFFFSLEFMKLLEEDWNLKSQFYFNFYWFLKSLIILIIIFWNIKIRKIQFTIILILQNFWGVKLEFLDDVQFYLDFLTIFYLLNLWKSYEIICWLTSLD